MVKRRSFGKTAVIIVSVTLLSKLLGFLRESIIAANFGATVFTDAYVIAVTIFTSLAVVAGESVNNAFIPSYISAMKRGEEESSRFAGTVTLLMFGCCLVLVLVGEIFTGAVVKLYVPAFSGEILELTTSLVRITLPVILVTSISLVAGGMLQARMCFFPQAFMGIPNHLLVILLLMAFGSSLGIKGLTMTAAAGTALQLGTQVPFIIKRKIRIRFTTALEMPEVKAFSKALVPVFLGSSARQINVLVDRALASLTGYGNISILNYANVINLTIIGLFITTIITILYPGLASSSDGNLADNTRKAMKTVLLAAVPVTAIVINYGAEIATILFERGEFKPEDSMQTGAVLVFYAVGLVPYAISDIASKAFYSVGNTRYPMIAGITAVVVNILLNLFLVGPLGIKGLALATSISMVVSTALLGARLHSLYGIFNRELGMFILKLLVAGTVCWTVSYFTGKIVTGLVVPAVAGAAVYVLVMYRQLREILST